MSYSIDANLLLDASDESSPLCEPAKTFLTECSRRPEPLCLCWPVVMAYLRIATHGRIFTKPLTPKSAMDNIQQLLEQPHSRLISEGKDFWKHYRRIADNVVVRANLVPDAHIAALLLEHDIPVIYTRDRDFDRFAGITTRDPFG